MRKLAVQQSGRGAAHFCSLRAVFALCDLVGGRCYLNKAVRENAVGDDKEYAYSERDIQHRKPAALPAIADDVQNIGRVHDLLTDGDSVHYELLNELVGIEADKVVKPEEHEREQDDYKRLALKAHAYLRNHPAEKAGEDKDEYAHQNGQQQSADNAGKRGLRNDKVDDDGRQHNDRAEHKPHEIYARKTRDEDVLRRDRQREHEVVVLGFIQARICVENAAENA